MTRFSLPEWKNSYVDWLYTLMVPGVCHSSLQRSCPVQHPEYSKATKWQGWELSSCAVWPRLGPSCQTLLPACCQIVLFRQSVQCQLAVINNQTSSSYQSIFYISCYKPTIWAIMSRFGLWYSQTNQNEKWALPRWTCAELQVLKGLVKNHLITALTFFSSLLGILSSQRSSTWNTLTENYALFHIEIYREQRITEL